MSEQFLKDYQNSTAWPADMIRELDQLSPSDEVSITCVEMANCLPRNWADPVGILNGLARVSGYSDALQWKEERERVKV